MTTTEYATKAEVQELRQEMNERFASLQAIMFDWHNETIDRMQKHFELFGESIDRRFNAMDQCLDRDNN